MEVQRQLREIKLENAPPGVQSKVQRVLQDYPPKPDSIAELRGEVKAQRFARGLPPQADTGTSDRAKKVKASPVYQDAERRQQANWLEKGTESFRKWIQGITDRKDEMPQPNLQGPSLPPMSLPEWFIVVLWVLLGLTLLTGIVMIARAVKFGGFAGRSRVRGSLASEEEDSLTLDEWLQRADRFASEGDHRQAVRCLYVAMLVRLDETGAIRFIRTDTNWEHYYAYRRYLSGRGEDLLREPTTRFDVAWYGHSEVGTSDSAWFRERYLHLADTLKRGAA